MIQTFPTKLTRKKKLADGVWYFRFDLTDEKVLSYKAGQYMILFVPQEGANPARRLYSILTAPHHNQRWFELVVKMVDGGVASTYLTNLQEGELAMFQGPAGLFTLREKPGAKVFFATGTGIAPIYSMIEYYLKTTEKPEELYLFWGMRTRADRYLLTELRDLAKKHPSFHPYYCLSREESISDMSEDDQSMNLIGRVHVGFDQICGSSIVPQDAQVYICGGRGAVETINECLAERHIPKEAIHFEKF